MKQPIYNPITRKGGVMIINDATGATMIKWFDDENPTIMLQKGNNMDNTIKLKESLDTLNTQMQDLNNDLRAVNQSLNGMDMSWEMLNEGLKDINDRLDALLKGDK